MVNGLRLYSAFIQSALQFMPRIHPFTHTFTHQRQLAAMQGTNQLDKSNWGLGVLLRDTSTHPGWDRTGNPPTARWQLYLLSHIAPLYLLFFTFLRKFSLNLNELSLMLKWFHIVNCTKMWLHLSVKVMTEAKKHVVEAVPLACFPFIRFQLLHGSRRTGSQQRVFI